MFGFFQPKWKRVALKVETLLMTFETAYENRDWDAFVFVGRVYTELLRKIHLDPTLEKAPILEFLQARGKVRSLNDREYVSGVTHFEGHAREANEGRTSFL